MSQAERTTNKVEAFFHPVSHYDTPNDVVDDVRLSTDEKRVILSSWASDMYVVESQPALREIPGLRHRLRLDDILAALKQLDDETDPPPRGGMAMRLPRLSKTDCIASGGSQRSNYQNPAIKRYTPSNWYRSMQTSRTPGGSRWTREENVRRYRKLLNTQLTDVERSFIERRLAEELRA